MRYHSAIRRVGGSGDQEADPSTQIQSSRIGGDKTIRTALNQKAILPKRADPAADPGLK